MKRLKIYLGGSCLLLVVGAVAATRAKAGMAAPEYYINDAQICVVTPQPTCCLPNGNVACLITVPGQASTKQVFDNRINGVCTTPLFCVQ